MNSEKSSPHISRRRVFAGVGLGAFAALAIPRKTRADLGPGVTDALFEAETLEEVTAIRDRLLAEIRRLDRAERKALRIANRRNRRRRVRKIRRLHKRCTKQLGLAEFLISLFDIGI